MDEIVDTVQNFLLQVLVHQKLKLLKFKLQHDYLTILSLLKLKHGSKDQGRIQKFLKEGAQKL